MSSKRRILRGLAALVMAAVITVCFAYLVTQYVCVDFRLYPREAQALDLTGEELTARQYEKLQKKLPECDITWSVPLSSGAWPSNAQSIALSSMEAADLNTLAYFTELKQIDARSCRDYELLQETMEAYPQVEVQYVVQLGQEQFAPDTPKIQVRDIPTEELPRLKYLQSLSEVVCAGGEERSALALREYCREAGIAFAVLVGDRVISEQESSAEILHVEEEQLALLRLLPNLKNLYLKDPQASAAGLLQLCEDLPGVQVAWELPVCGVVCTSGTVELDLTGGEIDLSQLRQALPYFPEAVSVYLGDCGIDNEELAAFREDMRDTVKIVWQVSLGKKLTARTDDTSFMPVREHVYYFNDEEAYNLRYCEEMVALDIGHMSIHNIDFVEFMPNLTYLILAHTQVQYIEPISTCKNLKFLELDWSPIRDLSPLVGCTSLEDLNLGKTYANFDPITEMTWLKNLWVINCNKGVTYKMTQALPDTKVQGAGNATVASGWRRLPNYYAMRDALQMYYMHWS